MSALSPRPREGRTIIAGILLFCCLLIPAAATTTSNAQSESKPANSLESLLAKGRARYDQRKFEEARTFFKEAVRRKSRSGEARYWLGVTHYEMGEDKEAAKQLRIAVRHDRRNPDIHLALGRTYMRMKNRMVEARQKFKDALRYNPDNAEVHYYLGLAYVAQSKRDIAAPLYVLQARRSFNRAAAANPAHPDAYYQLGLSYESPSRDYKRALSLYSRQLMINPTHRDALYHLEKCSYLLKRYQVGIDLLSQLIEMHGDDAPDYIHTLIIKLEATMLQSQDKVAEADRAYREYLNNADPEERAYYTNLAYVASAEVLEKYTALSSDAEKAEFQRRFWAARDPQAATIVNERIVEHFRRVMHAREHFSKGKQPWDRRGDIYIRYGEPDDMQHFIFQTGENPLKNYQPTGNARIDAIRERNFMWRYRLKVDNAGTEWSGPSTRNTRDPDAVAYLPEFGGADVSSSFTQSSGIARAQALGFIAESWVYIEHDMELFFVDQLGVGKFDFPLDVHETSISETVVQNRYHPRRIAKELAEEVPESFDYDYGGEPLRLLYDIVSFKGDDGRADIEITYMVPSEQLETVRDGRGLHTWFDSHMVFQNKAYERVAQVSKRIGPIDRPRVTVSNKQVGIELHTGMMNMESPSGSYRAAIEVRDEATRRIGVFEQEYTVPDYTGSNLTMSDINLAVSIKAADSTESPFIRNGLVIQPNPARLYQRTDPVHFYYEIYNLSLDESGRTAYQVELEVKTKDRARNIIWRLLKGLDRLVRRTDSDQSVLMVFENEGTRSDEYSYTSIDTGATPTGAYEMTVRVKDLQSGQIATRSKLFVVTNDRVSEFTSGTD